MGDMMTRWFQMILSGGDPVQFKLAHTHTIATDYHTTFAPIYTNEIAPHLTFGDYHKLCVCVFEGNTSTDNFPINMCYFSLGVDVNAMTSNSRNGGIIRNGFTAIRPMQNTYDSMCSAGTVLKIYILDT